VLDLTTPTAREVAGTKITLAAGELSTLRADVRHAGPLGDDRFGYRVNLGYTRSDTWDRSRTLVDGSSLELEYRDITTEPIPPNNPLVESRALSGQRIVDPVTGDVTGERDPVSSAYGGARLDYYADDGAVGTVEGGWARSANVVFMNGQQRVQLLESLRPWARVAWTRPKYQLLGWWSGQRHPEGALFFLRTGAPGRNTTNVFHLEGRYNEDLFDGRARLIAGTSYRHVLVNSHQTFLGARDDDRSDPYYAAFAQLEYRVTPTLRAVVAGRFDDGVAHQSQWSPKGALVFSPDRRHSIRVSASRGFVAPNYVQLFVRLPVGASDLTGLEDTLRAGSLGPALSGVPEGELFGQSAAVPVMVIGNERARVQRATGLELGYIGQLGDRVFLTADVYYERQSDFLTGSIPGVNPEFPAWTAPTAVPESSREELEAQVAAARAGLSRLEDGATAFVFSQTNAGTVEAFGLEFGIRLYLTPELRTDGSYAYFDSSDGDLGPAIPRAPNAPSHRGAFAITYLGAQGLAAGASIVVVGPFNFHDGDFQGRVPPRQTVNLTAGYQINDLVRVHAVATNVFNQRRFHAFGTSVIGRRALAGITLTF
jgi:outer membrane receptor protein involved in Fe transport